MTKMLVMILGEVEDIQAMIDAAPSAKGVLFASERVDGPPTISVEEWRDLGKRLGHAIGATLNPDRPKAAARGV